VLVIWRSLGLGEIIYEIVPGFAANLLTMMIVNRFNPGAAEPVGRLFDEVEKTVSSL